MVTYVANLLYLDFVALPILMVSHNTDLLLTLRRGVIYQQCLILHKLNKIYQVKLSHLSLITRNAPSS